MGCSNPRYQLVGALSRILIGDGPIRLLGVKRRWLTKSCLDCWGSQKL